MKNSFIDFKPGFLGDNSKKQHDIVTPIRMALYGNETECRKLIGKAKDLIVSSYQINEHLNVSNLIKPKRLFRLDKNKFIIIWKTPTLINCEIHAQPIPIDLPVVVFLTIQHGSNLIDVKYFDMTIKEPSKEEPKNLPEDKKFKEYKITSGNKLAYDKGRRQYNLANDNFTYDGSVTRGLVSENRLITATYTLYIATDFTGIDYSFTDPQLMGSTELLIDGHPIFSQYANDVHDEDFGSVLVPIKIIENKLYFVNLITEFTDNETILLIRLYSLKFLEKPDIVSLVLNSKKIEYSLQVGSFKYDSVDYADWGEPWNILRNAQLVLNKHGNRLLVNYFVYSGNAHHDDVIKEIKIDLSDKDAPLKLGREDVITNTFSADIERTDDSNGKIITAYLTSEYSRLTLGASYDPDYEPPKKEDTDKTNNGDEEEEENKIPLMNEVIVVYLEYSTNTKQFFKFYSDRHAGKPTVAYDDVTYNKFEYKYKLNDFLLAETKTSDYAYKAEYTKPFYADGETGSYRQKYRDFEINIVDLSKKIVIIEETIVDIDTTAQGNDNSVVLNGERVYFYSAVGTRRDYEKYMFNDYKLNKTIDLGTKDETDEDYSTSLYNGLNGGALPGPVHG